MATSMIYQDGNVKEVSEREYRVHTQWQEKLTFLNLGKQSSFCSTDIAVSPPVEPGGKWKSLPSISFCFFPKWISVTQTSQTQCSKINHCKGTTNVSVLKVAVRQTTPVGQTPKGPGKWHFIRLLQSGGSPFSAVLHSTSI